MTAPLAQFVEFYGEDRIELLDVADTEMIEVAFDGADNIATIEYVDGKFTDTGWMDFAPAAGWTVVYSRVRTKNGVATWRFSLTRASWTAAQALGTLTAPYRPSDQPVVIIASANGTLCEVTITTGGVITADRAGTVSLKGQATWLV